MCDTDDLLRRLKDLYNELKREEIEDQQKGNDEAACAIYAAAERLKEVVKDFIADQKGGGDGTV